MAKDTAERALDQRMRKAAHGAMLIKRIALELAAIVPAPDFDEGLVGALHDSLGAYCHDRYSSCVYCGFQKHANLQQVVGGPSDIWCYCKQQPFLGHYVARFCGR